MKNRQGLVLSVSIASLLLFCGCPRKNEHHYKQFYKGWALEKTLLIGSTDCRGRTGEIVDVSLPMQRRFTGNLANDIRVNLKPSWEIAGKEIPCQVHDIRNSDSVTTCRVAFIADIPPCSTLRAAVFYNNPKASKPHYASSLKVTGKDRDFKIENPFYIIQTDPVTGAISSMAMKVRMIIGGMFKTVCFTPPQKNQEDVSVILAVRRGAEIAGLPVSSRNGSLLQTSTEQGPVFFSMTRKIRLAPPDGSLAPERSPLLEICYKFYADVPYFLVYSRLEFPEETRVFGIRNGLLTVDGARFTHYTFRPVSPDLPLTDIEEMGYVMIDRSYTKGLADGLLLGGMIPYNIAWQTFLNIDEKYSLAGIQLLDSSFAPSGPAPRYRAATYAQRERGAVQWFRAPVYVGRQDAAENIILIPKGTVYIQENAILFSEWEKKTWLSYVDGLGKRLNNPARVSLYPRFIHGQVPPEEFEPLPQGRRADAYLRAGVR